MTWPVLNTKDFDGFRTSWANITHSPLMTATAKGHCVCKGHYITTTGTFLNWCHLRDTINCLSSILWVYISMSPDGLGKSARKDGSPYSTKLQF